jgi:ABC-type glycerol-3-phosphate transport system substrate-binding protein
MRLLAAAVLALAALVALPGCGGGDEATAPELRDLTTLDPLREDFEAAAGKTRVILLFAPL